jgi:Uma2 family endonuclease
MQPKIHSTYYSIEDYLNFEALATERSEYYQGEIFTMAGGTPNHNQIAGNLYVELSIALKRKDYRVYMADIKLWIPQKNSFNYPDVMVIAGNPQFYESHKDIILNPLIIIEVLSDSTEAYDRGDKFAQYRTLSSLQDYLLISQDSWHIEHFKKIAPHEWLFAEIENETARLDLISLGVTLNMRDIYDKVDFAPDEHH